MSEDATARWRQARVANTYHPELGMGIDVGAMALDAAVLEQLRPAMEAALASMRALEAGAIANADEQRQVGHYWLRAAALAPEPAIAEAIVVAREQVQALAADIHAGRLAPQTAAHFEHAVLVGIGGSCLGPQLVYDALGRTGQMAAAGNGPAGDQRTGQKRDGLALHFIDNTDPDGVDRLLAQLGEGLSRTLVVVISKSGGTKETRNGMLEMRAAFERKNLTFGAHAMAVTSVGSKLDDYAVEHGFLARLPMWDWVGGRTSVTSTVGLLPAALQGVDIDELLGGAAVMDILTRTEKDLWQNPAALLAAAWFDAGEGRGRRAMVMLPYKDRLVLVSRYLQQLVMESIGKRLDRDGVEVTQGLTVYGNKGSTDQHAYVQQLLDGPDNFFVTFLHVLRGRQGDSLEVEPGVTSADYLFGFLRGTRRALAERGRRSLTIWLERLDARRLGAIIALYERAVGLYAELVNVNAYHQPGVESGKRAAADTLALHQRVLAAAGEAPLDVEALAAAAGTEDYDEVLAIALHAAENDQLRCVRGEGEAPWQWRFARPPLRAEGD